MEPQPGVPQNSENSPGPIFLKVRSKRHELKAKHSLEKRKLVLLMLSRLKHSVRHTVQSIEHSPSFLRYWATGEKGEVTLNCFAFVLSANLSH